MPGAKDPCVKFSCILEKCTRVHNYQADKCEKELSNMLQCCKKFGPRLAPSCEGFHELDQHYLEIENKNSR